MTKAFTFFLLVCAAGCGNATGSRGGGTLSHAVATFACGPADGAATAILLASQPIDPLHPPVPNVRLTIDRDVRQLAGGSFAVNMSLGAWYQTGPNSTELASVGRVMIDRVDADLTVHGTADLTFPSARVFSEFVAAWRQSNALCG